MNNDIGLRIGDLIKELGMKKVRFAERIRVDQSYMTKLTKGKGQPSDLLITAICREFNVNETWLRTGKGKMFCQETTDNVISGFMGEILTEEPNFRRQLISLLARMSTAEWIALERKAVELVDGMKDKDNVKQAAEPSALGTIIAQTDQESEITMLRRELQEVRQENQEFKNQNQEILRQNKKIVQQNEALKNEIEAIKQEDELQNPWSDSDAG